VADITVSLYFEAYMSACCICFCLDVVVVVVIVVGRRCRSSAAVPRSEIALKFDRRAANELRTLPLRKRKARDIYTTQYTRTHTHKHTSYATPTPPKRPRKPACRISPI